MTMGSGGGNMLSHIFFCLYDVQSFPPSATTLHFEFYAENKEEKTGKKVSWINQSHQI